MDEEYRDDLAFQTDARAAIDEINDGAWLVNIRGRVFEVVEAPMTVEQDVYGCYKGRACLDVAAELRPGFDTMIEARTALGLGADDRHFHWYTPLDSRFEGRADARRFVLETLGSAVVADAAEILVENAATNAAGQDVAVHVTLLPDRMRLRVDDDGGAGREDRPFPALSEPSSKGIASIAERAKHWGMTGGRWGWSVWAEFARSQGDADQLATAYRLVEASKITPGAYVYRGGDHQAWVPVAFVRASGGKVYPGSLDDYPMPSFADTEMVPIFVGEEPEPS
jgi:hypothetical protein